MKKNKRSTIEYHPLFDYSIAFSVKRGFTALTPSLYETCLAIPLLNFYSPKTEASQSNLFYVTLLGYIAALFSLLRNIGFMLSPYVVLRQSKGRTFYCFWQ